MFKAAGFIQMALAPVLVIPAVTQQDEHAGGLEAQLEATKSSLEYIAGLRDSIRSGDDGAVRALLRATESPRSMSTVQRSEFLQELQDDLAQLRYSLDRLLADPREVNAVMGLPLGVLETLGLGGPASGSTSAPLRPDAGASATGSPTDPAFPGPLGAGGDGTPGAALTRTIPTSLLAGTKPTTGLDAHLRAAIDGEVGPLDEVSETARRRGDEPVPFEGEGFVADPVKLAQLLVRTGRTSEVIQLLRTKAKTPGERYWLARAYVAQERLDEALEIYRSLSGDESNGIYARHAAQDLEFLEFERSLRKGDTRR